MDLGSRHKQKPVKRLLDRCLHGSRRGVDVNDHLRLLLVRALGGCLNFHVNKHNDVRELLLQIMHDRALCRDGEGVDGPCEDLRHVFQLWCCPLNGSASKI